jgi:crotonobetainyl-CoA:carnitine CoA-transferase CaiB-like acyl-CoA transferase
VLIEAFAQHDGEYWEANLSAEGVPCGLVRDVRQVCERIAGFDRDLILPTTVPGRPPDKSAAHFVNAGFKFAHDGPGAAGAAPLLGEHSVEVLQTLGYSEHEIGALIEGHAVAARSTAPC